MGKKKGKGKQAVGEGGPSKPSSAHQLQSDLSNLPEQQGRDPQQQQQSSQGRGPQQQPSQSRGPQLQSPQGRGPQQQGLGFQQQQQGLGFQQQQQGLGLQQQQVRGPQQPLAWRLQQPQGYGPQQQPLAYGQQQPLAYGQQQPQAHGSRQQPPHAWRQPPPGFGHTPVGSPAMSPQRTYPQQQPIDVLKTEKEEVKPMGKGKGRGTIGGDPQLVQSKKQSIVVGGSGDIVQTGAKLKEKGKGKVPKDGAPETSQKQAGSGDTSKELSSLGITDEIKPMEYRKFPPGTKGRVIKVETNHLSLNLGKLESAIHYDVNIIPDTPKKFLRSVMEMCRQKYYSRRYPAFDGRKNLYSTFELPFGQSMVGDITYHDSEGREKPYKIEIKFAKKVDLRGLKNYELSRKTPQDALQVVDIVLRSAPASTLISVGRSFFVKPREIIDLGEGMEMYHGFYQSAIRGWKPFLNVDVAHKAFPKPLQVIDALMEVLSTNYKPFHRDDLNRKLDRRDLELFEKFIKTLRVIYEIPGQPSSKRTYRVNQLSEPADEKTFTLDNGQTMTIRDYFQNQKRCRLRYPSLPTLWVGDKQRKNPILLPMELCTLEEGQVLNRKMTENQTAKMIKSSATNTELRKRKIINGLRNANHNAHPTIREFGFSVADSFQKLDARVLQPPKLEYKEKRQILPFKGVWRGDKFFIGAQINSWTIVAADRRPPRNDDFSRMEDEMYRQAQQTGLVMTSRAAKPFYTMGATLPEIQKYFQSVKGKYDVIFVIVPNSGPQYSFVKKAAEINSGCLTQCIKMRTLSRLNGQTAVNILLKVNAKLNGTNHHLATRPTIMNRPTMIMGADVTHPGPDSRDIPSVAAVTASHDPKAFQYNICWRLQPPKQEKIDDLKNITLEHLRYFFEKTNGLKPERIIFFRDGVSEGFFDEIRDAEIKAIRAACKTMQSNDYEPSITFLVVQKRHHTRLFPLNPKDSEDRNNNVPAGTCIDTDITHPFMQDFYLVSHASIQGVAKPTKYCTLWDDNNLTNDDIEELTYFLCHMFTRCNRSVSYPAPTYYAHLAAARGKVYIENERLDMNNLNREYSKFEIVDDIRKKKPMFFV